MLFETEIRVAGLATDHFELPLGNQTNLDTLEAGS